MTRHVGLCNGLVPMQYMTCFISKKYSFEQKSTLYAMNSSCLHILQGHLHVTVAGKPHLCSRSSLADTLLKAARMETCASAHS